MLPEAVAYAGIAGLPPQRALTAAVAGCLVYVLVGRSRFAIVSPTSSSAAILAAALASFPGEAAARLALATLAVFLTGLFFCAAASVRLGGLTGFISRPVLRGFAFGLAVTIIIRQLPSIFGVPVGGGAVFDMVGALFASAGHWHGASIATGTAALAILLLLRRLPLVPGAFVVLVGGIGASALLNLPGYGVNVVGPIDLSLSWPELPQVDWRIFSRIAQITLPLVLMLFAESWGTMRAMALRHGDVVEPNRELMALGFANLAAAAVQGMPVGAGFSAGSMNEAAGAQSRAAAALAGATLALLVLVAGNLIALLPQPVLAAVVIAALTHALDPSPLLRLWKLRRDQYVALGAAAGVFVLGVLNGMLFAIALSLIALIRRIASPQLMRLGRLDDSHDFVDIARHPDAVQPSGIAIWRPAEPLFFGNAERVLGCIAEQQAKEPAIKAIILSLEESFDLDSTAADSLVEFDKQMQMRGTRVQLARVRDHIRDLLEAAGAHDLVRRSSYSVDDAVVSLMESKRG